MKKREITNKDVEKLFSNIVEQAPLVSEEQLISLINNSPPPKLDNSTKSFFKYHLNTLLLSTTVILIIVAATLIWFNSGKKAEDIVVQNKPQKHLVAPASLDTITDEKTVVIIEEISPNITTEDSVLKETTTKKSSAVILEEKTTSLVDIYKHFDRKPQIFSIKANRDTTLICKEGTRIKINANSFVSKKSGNEIAGTIQLAVKEYYKMSDIILSNLTTTSGNEILETGGMLHIAASANNEIYTIKPGSDIEIGFPYSDKKEDMELFYGQQTNDKIDWKLANPTDNVVVQEELNIVHSQAESELQVFFIVEDMPEFPGGDAALRKYIEKNVHYPYSLIKDKIEGKVFVTFIVDSKGNTRNIRVARSLDKRLDKVAIYVISNLPKWKPGTQRGKPVDVSYTIPVTFSAKEGELTPQEIRQSKELEEKLKDFKFDIETNSYYSNSKEFDEFEKKVKDNDFQETTVSEVNRYIFSVTQLGWINCDRFYKNDKPNVNFFILTDNSEETKINAISRKFKSLIPGKNKSGKIAFNNIPIGEEITIVALKTVNNKIFLSVNETEIQKNGELVLEFHPVTLELLKKEMEKLNKYY